MNIRDILEHKGDSVDTVSENATIHDAIGKLNEKRIGALVVVESDGGVTGIITERDILRECGHRCVALKDPPARNTAECTSLVRDCMTTDLVVAVPDDSLEYVMGIMTKNRVRHLPVMHSGKLVGIVSIGDVVNAHVGEQVHENRLLNDYIHGTIR